MTRAAAVSTALLLVVVPVAPAGFPGANGRIVFTQRAGPLEPHKIAEFILCSSDPDGSGQSRLTAFGAPSGSATFSPGGARLAFVTSDGGVTSRLVVAHPNGADVRAIASAGPYGASWSADGQQLYATLDDDLFAVRADDGNLTQLTATPERAETHAVPSPDGMRLAYVDRAPLAQTLVIAAPDASSPRPILTRQGMTRPDWSPDSTELVFAGLDGIWAVAAGGSPLRRLRPSGRDPVYSPDGRRIAFVENDDVWTMATDGSDVRRVTDTPTFESAPAWQPAGAPVQAAGTAPCTISGTTGDDVLVGTPGRDVFVDWDGNDTIRALGGHDVVLDGPGDDVIVMGGDGDSVTLQEGTNRVDGGAGDDTIGPMHGVDDPPDVDEPQTLVGGPGFDRLRGGRADDRLDGGTGRDLLAGDRGADRVTGGRGRDELRGGAGNDLLLARDRAADHVSGGGGIDRAQVDRIDSRSGVERLLPGAKAGARSG